jgi:lipopolysaccharide/colanic/teichoic acid biosynthesis glycosyltransferase
MQYSMPWQKRALDLAVALALLPFAALLCGLLAIAIAIECRGAPFFMQTRVGRYEKSFRLLKLRTMAIGTATGASHEVGTATILQSGKLLRKLKIDELPQLWNVLAGDMSLVGPRPGLPTQAELTACRRAAGVYALTPGITGAAQVQGIDMSTPELLANVDATYIGPWSLRRDLSILVQTIFGGGRGDAASSSVN